MWTSIRVLVTFYGFLSTLAQDSAPVTCGSTIKILHKDTKYYLHSHAIVWGSGSGQQSVTATSTQTDANSLWVVSEPMKSSSTCELAMPIPCGSVISLEHAGTGIIQHCIRSLNIVYLIIILSIYIFHEYRKAFA